MHIPLHEDAIDNRSKLLSAGGILLAPSRPLAPVQRGDVRELHALTNLLAGLHGSKLVLPGQVQWELDIQRDHVDKQAFQVGCTILLRSLLFIGGKPWAQPSVAWTGGSDSLIGQGPHLEHVHHLQVLLLQRSAQLAQQLVTGLLFGQWLASRAFSACAMDDQARFTRAACRGLSNPAIGVTKVFTTSSSFE